MTRWLLATFDSPPTSCDPLRRLAYHNRGSHCDLRFVVVQLAVAMENLKHVAGGGECSLRVEGIQLSSGQPSEADLKFFKKERAGLVPHALLLW